MKVKEKCRKLNYDLVSMTPDFFDQLSISNLSSFLPKLLKYGFHNMSFILNAPLVSCPIPVILFGWVQQQTYPKQNWATDQR